MAPTRNFTRPRTSASVVRGSVMANRRTSPTVTMQKTYSQCSTTPLHPRTGENPYVKLPKALTPLAERNFRYLWTGQAVSAAGDALAPVALAFATLQIANSASALGLVLAASTAARVVLLPIGGVWADRLPRQLVMLSSDSIRAVAELTLAVVLLSGHAQLWMLIVLSVADGAAAAFFMPAYSALVPQTVSATHLQ